MKVPLLTRPIEPTAYEDYEGSIFGQLEKILKDAHEPHRIESKESEDDRNPPLGRKAMLR